MCRGILRTHRWTVSLLGALCAFVLCAVGAQAQPFPPSPTLSVPLLAGQTTRVGAVNVRVEGADLVVEYALDPDWSLNETHLDVESSWTLIPQNRNHNPIPGQFAQGGQHPPGTRTVSYRRPLLQLRGRQLAIAAQADVVHSSGRREGAWGAGTRFTPQGNWATWFTYTPGDQVVLDQGPGWVLIDVRGTTGDQKAGLDKALGQAAAAAAGDGVAFEAKLYLLYGELGINNVPLPESFRAELLADQLPEELVHIVSKETVDGIVASEAAGALTPEIAAIAEPDDTGSQLAFEEKGLFSSCATHTDSISRSYDLGGKSFDKDFSLGSHFTGHFHARGELDGSVTGVLTYDKKRRKVFGKCVTYSLGFNNARLSGNADGNAEASLTGTYSRDDHFGPREIAKPHLGTVTFTVAYIPVTIGFNLPISTGMDLKTQVTGTIDYKGTKLVSGNFDWTCTLHECHGSGEFDSSQGTNTITAGVNGRVNAEPWLDVGVRAYLYTEWFAYAQVGARPYLLGDLWGYAGNNCGDADGDGSFETVRALTFDVDYKVDFTAQTSAFGGDPNERVLRAGTPRHAFFFDIIGSDAMQPMLRGPKEPIAGTAANYQVQMRPCWPYTDNVNYSLNWGDGSAAQSLAGAPQTAVAASHTWSEVGDKTLTATSVDDLHGRGLDQSYSRTIQVKPCAAPAISQQPSNQTIDSGQSATLFVVSDGTVFQWYQGNSGDTSAPVSGATGNTLIVTPQQTTSYWVRVSNACGGHVDSAAATVTVNVSCSLPGTDGQACGGDGNHTCQGGQCVCSNCASGVCCGSSGNSYCDGQSFLDANTGYTGICTSSLGGCSAANDFDGTNTVYHDGDVFGCVKANGNFQWYKRRPSPRCQEVANVCGFLCSTHYADGNGFMCDQDGVWNQNPPLSYCYGGTIPEGWSCQAPPACTPPQIISQPQSTSIQQGQSASLSTAASGTSPAFQWYRGTSGDVSNPLAGGTVATIVVSPATTTSYWARASNGCGTADTQTATVTVEAECNPFSILSQPQSQTITAGQSATLSVSNSGTPPFSYQWYRGVAGDTSNPVPGGNSPSITVAPATTTSYWVRISNDCNSVNSTAATVTVVPADQPPAILVQPQPAGIVAGQSATLSVSASGTNLDYQWYQGASGNSSQPVPGATSSSVTVAPISTTSYWVRVANAVGTVDSNAAQVTVTPACVSPAITSQPQPTTIQQGQSATLTAAVGGTSPTFQWYRGSSPDTSSPVAGGTGASVVVAPTSTTSYWLRASNACGFADSQSAQVTVTPICVVPSITQQPQPATITAGDSTTLSVGANGTSPLSYQWYRGPVGSTFDPVAGGTGSSVVVAPPFDTNYWVRVSNACGFANSNGVTVTVLPACEPPSIQGQPQSVTINPGDSTMLSVSGSGTSLQYQWYQGTASNTSSPIANGNGAALFVSPPGTTSYWVRLFNDCGIDDSVTATVTVTGCGPDGAACGGDGHHTCRNQQCVCSDCGSPVCCGSSGNSFCDGQQFFDNNTGYTGACASTLPSCSPANDFDGDNELYHDGDIYGCVKANGTHEWFPRRPSPRCLEVTSACTYLCAYNYQNGQGFQCETSGWWSQNPPLPYCFGGTIPDGFACN